MSLLLANICEQITKVQLHNCKCKEKIQQLTGKSVNAVPKIKEHICFIQNNGDDVLQFIFFLTKFNSIFSIKS
jgi:hypothetical protein